MSKANSQAKAIIEVAKGLHAIAEAIKAKGANVPAIQTTASTGNPTDDAIIEVAKGVHQIKEGVTSLPNGDGEAVQNEPIACKKIDRITINIKDVDKFFSGGSMELPLPSVGDYSYSYKRRYRLIGDYGDAITPTEIMGEPGILAPGFQMHRYVPEVTVETIIYGEHMNEEYSFGYFDEY